MKWSSLGALLLNALHTFAQETSVFSKASNDTLLWGPYRPNLYFGIRPRLTNALTTSLLWGRAEDYQTMANTLRFTCEQHSGMDGYGWDVYDPRSGGVQTVRDRGNGIDLETSFVKFDEPLGSWAARIKGTVREDAEPGVGSQNGVRENLKTSVIFTLGVVGVGSEAHPVGAETGEGMGFEGDVTFEGQTMDLGDFQLTITAPEANSHPSHKHESYQFKPLDRTLVHSVMVPQEALWQGRGKP